MNFNLKIWKNPPKGRRTNLSELKSKLNQITNENNEKQPDNYLRVLEDPLNTMQEMFGCKGTAKYIEITDISADISLKKPVMLGPWVRPPLHIFEDNEEPGSKVDEFIESTENALGCIREDLEELQQAANSLKEVIGNTEYPEQNTEKTRSPEDGIRSLLRVNKELYREIDEKLRVNDLL